MTPMPHNTAATGVQMNTAFRIAQARYDNAEPDWSAYDREEAVNELATEYMKNEGAISDAFSNGFKVSDQLAAMLAEWEKKPAAANTVEIVRALSDALWMEMRFQAEQDITAQEVA